MLLDKIQSAEICDDSEVSLARHFASILTESFDDACSTQGALWTYKRGLWERMEPESVLGLIQAYNGLSFVRMGGKEGVIKLSNSKVHGIYQSVLVCRELLRPGFFDEHVPGVSFLDGFVALRDGSVMIEHHSPDQKSTMRIDQMIPDFECVPEKFIGFLNELFLEDEDIDIKINLVREFVGAALCGMGVTFQQAILCIGAGANGKSTLCRIIEGLFPPEQVSSTSPARWSNEYQIALLANARLNVCTELPSADHDVSDLTKAILAGDTVIGRMPYQKPQKLRPRASHIFSSNHLPSVKDFSEGFFRRFLILTFNRSFTKEGNGKSMDQIVKSMEKERAKIVMWCMMGAMMLVHRGRYEAPASGNTAEMEWRVEADSVLDFIVSCCERRDQRSDFEYFSAVYEDFKEWCYKTGRKPMGHRTFGRRLTLHEVAKEKIGGQSKVGLQLKPRINWSDWGMTH